MRKLLFALAALFVSTAAGAYGFIGTTNAICGGACETTPYTPASGNSLIGVVWAQASMYPLTGYSGSGTPGDGVNTYILIGYTISC